MRKRLLLNGTHGSRVCNHSSALICTQTQQPKEGQPLMLRGQAGPTAPGWSCPEFCLQLLLSSSALRQNLQLAQCPTHAKGNALRCSSASCQMSGFRKVSLLQCQRSSVPTPSLLTADQHLQFHTLAPDSLSDAPSGCPQIKSIHWHNFIAQAISSLPLPCTMQTLSFL